LGANKMKQEHCGVCKKHWKADKPGATTGPGSRPGPEGERTNTPDDAPTLKPKEITQLLTLMGKCVAKADDPSSVVIRNAMQEIQKNQPPETLDTLLQRERALGEKHRKLAKTRQQLEEQVAQQLDEYNRNLQNLKEAKDAEDRVKQEAGEIRERIVGMQKESEAGTEKTAKTETQPTEDAMQGLVRLLMSMPGFGDVLKQTASQIGGDSGKVQPDVTMEEAESKKGQENDDLAPTQVTSTPKDPKKPIDEPPAKQPRVGDGADNSGGTNSPPRHGA